MKSILFWSYRDGMDGSHIVKLHSKKEEALKELSRTEEELQNGNIYDDGSFGEIEVELDENGKLVSEVNIYIE